MDNDNLEKRYIRSQLRLPADLYERIKGAAEESGRSMNAEIVNRLEGSFESEKVEALVAQRTSELMAAITELGAGFKRMRERSEQMEAALDERDHLITELVKVAAGFDPPAMSIEDVTHKLHSAAWTLAMLQKPLNGGDPASPERIEQARVQVAAWESLARKLESKSEKSAEESVPRSAQRRPGVGHRVRRVASE